MSQTHWILDTCPINPSVEEVAFFGFLYGKRLPDCANHVLYKARVDPDGFLRNLNGGLCGFVHLKDGIIVFNDRFGYGKVYLSESPEGLYFCTFRLCDFLESL